MEEKTIKRGTPVAALEALRKKRAAGLVGYSSPLEMLKKHPSSIKRAVNAKCFVCIGGSHEEAPPKGWRQLIAFCGKSDCPLYFVRPFVGSFSHLSADGDDK